MAFDLYRVILPVKDIEAAVHFYARVLCVGGERVSPGRHYFACGQTILACYDPVADGDAIGTGWLHHASQYIYFATNELEATLERVRDAGGEITAPIETMPWGERMFYAKDSFGNPISFVDERTVFRGSGTAKGQ
jgi:predicted enzyme related to lactoylglutathione lyase